MRYIQILFKSIKEDPRFKEVLVDQSSGKHPCCKVDLCGQVDFSAFVTSEARDLALRWQGSL